MFLSSSSLSSLLQTTTTTAAKTTALAAFVTARRRFAAEAKKGGSKAKGGQAKTAIKGGGGADGDAVNAIPLFQPNMAQTPRFQLSPEPINPLLHNMKYTPTYALPYNALRHQLDIHHREQYAVDSRFELFDKTSPKRLAMGSALLIEHYTSRTNPVVHYTAGVLCAVVRKGLLTSFTLRHYVAGSGVEVTFKVFSPMIKTIKVLKRIEPEDMIKQYKNKTTSYNSTMASVASKANPSSSSSTTTAASPRGSLSGFLTLPPKPVESNSFRKKRRHLLVSSSATSSENKELKRTVEEDFMRRFTLDPYKPFDMEIIRTHPRLAPVPYSKVDEMVIRERETQKRLAAGEAGN